MDKYLIKSYIPLEGTVLITQNYNLEQAGELQSRKIFLMNFQEVIAVGRNVDPAITVRSTVQIDAPSVIEYINSNPGKIVIFDTDLKDSNDMIINYAAIPAYMVVGVLAEYEVQPETPELKIEN